MIVRRICDETGIERKYSMAASGGGGDSNSQLPVFVFPHSLAFYLDNVASLKQILTLYNPYDFQVKFKVLCTSPRKYSVIDPEGVIRSRCCVDIVIRCNDLSPSNHNRTDQFRIQMTEYDSTLGRFGTSAGKRDITAVLSATKSVSSPDEDPMSDSQFEQLNPAPKGSAHMKQYKMNQLDKGMMEGQPSATGLRASAPSPVVVITALVCVIALMLPTDGDRTTSLPSYLHLNHHQKLIAAYTLGLVTMVIFKP